MKPSRVGAFVLLIASVAIASPCYRIGQIVTVRGHAISGVNDGTDFELLKPICVYYPTSPVTRNSVSLMQHHKVPVDVYMDITGPLIDDWHRARFLISVTSMQSVDSEVRAELVAVETRCREWQDKNIPDLIKRAHGAQVSRIYNKGPRTSNICGIWANDEAMPHKYIAVWRQEAK
jgi:hypothetical protein